MRIFFLSYAHEKGLTADAGGFRKVWELAWALRKAGSDVLVLYPRLPGHGALTPVPSRTYAVVDLPLLRPLSAYLGMVATALAAGRRERPEIVYFRSCESVLPFLLRWALGARMVLEVNADTLEFLQVEGASRLARLLFRLAEAANARRSDLVVAITPGLKRMLTERYGIPESKVWVIPSGTDPEHFAPEEAGRARQRIGLDPDRPVVGFVGLFYRHQGIPTLLEALALLRSAHPKLVGLIVGDGVMRPAWQRLAHRLGIADAVRFPGQVPYREVPTYFNAMDVAVAPLTAARGETSPFKVLDAMACARPVVASDLASVRPLAEASGALTLVRPEDPAALAAALGSLLADPTRRQAMGAQGRAFVLAHHAWDRIAERLLAAFGGAPPAGR